MQYKPSTIIKCMSNQSSYIGVNPNNMYYFTDRNQLWYDTTDKHRVQATDVIILYHEYERNNFIPNNEEAFVSSQYETEYFTDRLDYVYVYVVESNSFYKYQKGTWYTMYGIYGKPTVAQTYYPDGTYTSVSPDDVTSNGILNDGSVVVRDGNRMICGILKSNGYVLDINSLIGEQLNLNPSGKTVEGGTLSLNSNAMGYGNIAFLNGNLVVFGDIYQASAEDWNKQFRLLTEDVSVTSNTIIKKGSTIKESSNINGTLYEKDTQLISDLIVELTSKIAKGSKLYKGSVINNIELKPPFLFDINLEELKKL